MVHCGRMGNCGPPDRVRAVSATSPCTGVVTSALRALDVAGPLLRIRLWRKCCGSLLGGIARLRVLRADLMASLPLTMITLPPARLLNARVTSCGDKE